MNAIAHGFLTCLLVLMPALSHARMTTQNGFYIEPKSFSFTNKIGHAHCKGVVPYPYFHSTDEELATVINVHVENFVEQYGICNQGNRNHYSVSYQLPPSGNKDFFSILWITKRYDTIVRIDTMNINAENGEKLDSESIFHIHSNNLIHEMIKLSGGHLSFSTDWEDFLTKMKSGDIQLYLDDNSWHIVFNATPTFNQTFYTKLPRYFLKYRQ